MKINRKFYHLLTKYYPYTRGITSMYFGLLAWTDLKPWVSTDFNLPSYNDFWGWLETMTGSTSGLSPWEMYKYRDDLEDWDKYSGPDYSLNCVISGDDNVRFTVLENEI